MDLSIEDWDELFKAVQARLRLTAEAATDAARLKTVVLECVDALDSLHAALRDQRHLCRSQAIELAAMRDALAFARATRKDGQSDTDNILFRDLLGEALVACCRPGDALQPLSGPTR